MAEEDLIFGKNRHFFGGIEPANMQVFEAYDRSGGIRLYLTLPTHTVIDDQILCTVGGVVIRKSTTGFPKDEFSGVEVANIVFDGLTTTHEIFDEDVIANTTYYYSAFPYTTQGVYNRNAAMSGSKNRYSCKKTSITYGYLYGFDIDTRDSNPETRVSYPSDVDNHSWGYVTANTTGTNYGLIANGNAEWLEHIQPGVDFTPRPCMLNFDGTVAEYLDPYDYTKNINGVTSTLNTSGNGTSNAMMEWPKIYTKREEIDGVYKFRCSDVRIDDDWDCWCNYDKNNNVIDHFYTAIYPLTSNVSNSECTESSGQKYRSLCNCQYLKSNENLDTMITRARENGDDWDIEQLCDRLLIIDLLILITKTTNIQSRLGNGIVYGSVEPTYSWQYAHSGADIHKYGLFYGKIGDVTSTEYGQSMVKIFGMLNWYGCRHRFIAGHLIKNVNSSYSIHYYKSRRGTGYNINDTYMKSDYNSSITYQYDGYLANMRCYPFGRVPGTVGGSSSTYECDMIDIDLSTGDDDNHIYVPLWGGSYDDRYKAGPYRINATVRKSLYIGAVCTTSLSCKPSKVE